MTPIAGDDTVAPFTLRLWKALSGSILSIIKSAEDRTGARLAALETRIAALEARPTLEYLGTWTEGRSYSRGAVVGDAGSLWIQHKSPTSLARPGTTDGAASWTLAVKRGQDGKDAR